MNLKGVAKQYTSNTVIKIVIWNYNNNYNNYKNNNDNNYKNNNDNNSWFKHKYTVFEGETPEVISIRRAS